MVSPDGRLVTLSLEKSLAYLVDANPPNEDNPDLKVLVAGDNAGFNHNGSKGAGGQTNFGVRLLRTYGHQHTHKPLKVHLLALWEGGDKHEHMVKNLQR